MRPFLSHIDIYGTKFHCFTNNQIRFEALFGGILIIIIS